MTADSKQGERSGESALSRWSRRKLEARQQSADKDLPSAADTAPDAAATAVDATAPDDAEKPVLTDADMPDIDGLDENSDFSPFMSAGVSDRLRNLALRKLFLAPAFNIRDGLDDYDEDFTSFEELGNIVTSDMKHRVEMEQQKLREKLAAEQAAADEAETASTDANAAGSAGDDEPGAPGDVAGDGQASLDPDADGEASAKDEVRHG